MRLGTDKELISIEDIFENDEFVLMKAIYKKNAFRISVLSVGLKDGLGDIVRIVDVEERYL
ncbi:MAG: hypothetical protein K2L19_03200 [Eubacterium sp.]|nr:hypothetical protein [Eubacterium sp.]